MDLLSELKQPVASGEAVIVVGTGISIQATNNARCASWAGLIEDGIAYAVDLHALSKSDAKTIRQQAKSKDPALLLAAAEVVTAKLGSEFGPWLERSISPLRAINREVLDLLSRFAGVVATTNYDHLLTEVTGRPPVPWTEEKIVEQVLRGRRQGILHLHGSYDAPESVVFGSTSYERLVNRKHSQAVLTAIRTLRTLIFIGCGEGLSDPHFATFFKWTEEAFEHSIYPHFILGRSKEVPKIRKQQRLERKLHPIAYGKEYDDLPAFLTTLLPASVAKPDPPPDPQRRTLRMLPDSGPCYGRDDEIHVIVETLLAATPTRIAVLGTAGLGKTTLTLRALHDSQVRARYGDAMFFVRCDAASSVDSLVGAIATEVGVSGAQSLLPLVLNTLAQKPSILVLDNFETPWQAMTLEVEEFLVSLTALDTLQLIVTLRGKERPAGVSWQDPIEPPLLAMPAARQAFLAIAGTRFLKDPQLDVLLERMDRLPLAISLLAHAAQSEPSLDVVMERWEKKRTAMLKRAGGKQRLTNIEVSFELSIASPRVTPEAHRLLSVLAILPAGIAHADLSTVFDDGDEVASVLRATGLAFDEVGRLRMLAPLRAYVSHRYPLNLEDENRVTDHYFAATKQVKVLGHLSGGDAVLATLPSEAPNIESVINRTIEADDLTRVGPAAARYAHFVVQTGIGSIDPLLNLSARAEEKNDQKALLHALRGLGHIELWAGRCDSAREYFQRAITIAKEQRDGWAERWLAQSMGHVEERLGNLPEAKIHFEQALALSRKGDDEMAVASTLLNLAHIETYQELIDSAQTRIDEALPILHKNKAIGAEAFCVYELARILEQKGDFKEARKRCQEALDLFKQVGSILYVAACHRILGRLCLNDGDEAGAIVNLEEALTGLERLGDQLLVGDTHVSLAGLAVDSSSREQHLASARAAWRSIGRDDLVKKLDSSEN